MALDELTTEQPNPRSFGIDAKDTEEILRIINAEDALVAPAVRSRLHDISLIVDLTVTAFKQGGRLFYAGAGTSGRLGVLDAAECPPTFGTSPDMVQAIIAGGEAALTRSVEGAEDSEADGESAVEGRGIGARDVLIGITASGQAPFVIGAMKSARRKGACVVAFSCNRDSEIFSLAEHVLFVDVGPEIITGSTRLKSGTAQKLVLNMITTASMIRMGKVYNNLMVDLTPVNRKLIDRSKRLISQATGCDRLTAEKAYAESGRNPRTAILMLLLGVGREEAVALLKANDMRISPAIKDFHGRSRR